MRLTRLALVGALVAAGACDDGSGPTTPDVAAPDQITTGRQGTVQFEGKVHVFPARGRQPPAGAAGTNIFYHGGPIVPATKVQAIYWATTRVYAKGPAPGTIGTGAQDASLIGHFLRNLGGSPYFNINTTYTDNVNGGHRVANSVIYSHFWADNTNVPPKDGTPVPNADIFAEIVRGFNSGSLTYNASTVYLVFTAGRTNLGGGFTESPEYCGYHGYFTFNGKVVLFAALPYDYAFPAGCTVQPPSPNNNPGADAEMTVLAHEIEEAATDPRLNAWYDDQGMENADKCAWTFGRTYTTANGGLANMNLGGKDFLIQRNWINSATGGCRLRA
jgi:phosphate-induced protein 1